MNRSEANFSMKYLNGILEFFSENISDWTSLGFIKVSEFKQSYATYSQNREVSAFALNNALREYCQLKGLEVKINKAKKIDGKVFKCHVFCGTLQ